MNKTDLINQLAERLDGDKKAAQAAVEGIIDLVQREVQKGRSVSISGFGVFEKRLRAARTARNPRTGEAVKVKKTTVPAFRPGKYFKDVIAGTVKRPWPTGKPTSARAAAAAAKAPSAAVAKTTTTRAPGRCCRREGGNHSRYPGPAKAAASRTTAAPPGPGQLRPRQQRLPRPRPPRPARRGRPQPRPHLPPRRLPPRPQPPPSRRLAGPRPGQGQRSDVRTGEMADHLRPPAGFYEC